MDSTAGARASGTCLSSLPAALHATVLAAAGVAWGLSLRGADLSRIADLGLLDAMPTAYFIAFGLLLAGFTTA